MGKAIWAGVGVVAAAAAAVVGGAAWGGHEAERQYRGWIAELNDPQAGVTVTGLAYERGLFSARATTRIEWRAPLAAAGAPPLVLIAEHRVQHGPLAPADWIAEGRWTPRLGAMRTTLHLDPASAAALPGLRTEAEAAHVDTLLGFDGTSTHAVTVAGLDYAAGPDGDALKLAPLSGRYTLSRERVLKGELAGAGFTLRTSVAAPVAEETAAAADGVDAVTAADDGTTAPDAEPAQPAPQVPQGPLPREPRVVDAADLKLVFEQTVQRGGHWPGTATLAFGRVAVGTGSGEPIAAFERPQVVVTLKTGDGTLYDLREAFSAERILAGGQPWGSVRFTLVGERLARTALDELRDLYTQTLQTGGMAGLEEPATQARLAAIGRKALATRPVLGVTDIDVRPIGQQPVTGRLLVGLRQPAAADLPPQAFLREVIDTLDLALDAPALAWGDAANAGADSGRLEGLSLNAKATPGVATVEAGFRLDRFVLHALNAAGATDVTLAGLRGGSRQQRGQTTLLVGDANADLDELHIVGGAGEEPADMKLKGFAVQVQATEDGEYLGIRERFALAGLELAGQLQGHGELTLAASRLHAPTLLKVQRAGDDLSAAMTAGGQPDPSTVFAALMELLPHKPVLAFENVRIEKTGEPLALVARLALTLQPPADPAAPDAVLQAVHVAQGRFEVPESFLRLIVAEQVRTMMTIEAEQADMERRLSPEAGADAQAGTPEAPLAPVAAPDPQLVGARAQAMLDEQLAPLVTQGWVARADGKLTTDLDYRDAKLTLNGVELPIAQMFSGE